MKKFLLVIMVVALTAAITGCGSSSSSTTTSQQQQKPAETQQTQPAKPTVAYEISKIEDVSAADVKRFDYYVLVKEQADKDQLKLICENVTEKAKKDTPFNALTIYLYDRPEYVGKAATLGYAVYTVDGNVEKANQVKTGEYDKMSYKWELKSVDWNKRPTDAEMKIYAEWEKAKQAMKEAGQDFSESDFAQKVGVAADKVKEIVNKNVEWVKENT